MATDGSSDRHPATPEAAIAVPRKSTPGSTWTDQETSNLIDAYEEKWNSSKRGPLKAQQWEEVASEVAARCGLPRPSKSGTQCRHKVEKLRKRYRSERLRPVRSLWPFFDRIDRMERGPLAVSARPPPPPPPPASSSSFEDEENDPSEPHGSNTRSINGILRGAATPWVSARVSARPRKRRAEEDEEENEEDSAGGGLAEVAAELRRFGEGYVRMERRRMEMTREMEREWMEMEARRLELVMEAQRCMVETVAAAFWRKAKNSEDFSFVNETWPKLMVLPEDRRHRLSMSSKTSAGWWMEAITVPPRCRAWSTIPLMTWNDAALSSPLVGSSRKRNFGRVKISVHIAYHLHSLPLLCPRHRIRKQQLCRVSTSSL